MIINKIWHEKHRMPVHATLLQRINWHIQHAKHCGCRPMPESVADALKDKKYRICSRSHRFIGKGSCPICYPGRKEN